jgi:outer membrane receptor protein involved in Fe transport
VDYSLYRTDLYAAAERYHNYGYYLRARWRPSPRWELDAGVRLDSDDFDDYLTLNLLARWEF